MTSRQLRLLRGAAASSVATILAAVSHTVGGGAPPHPLLVVALSVFLLPVAAILVGRVPGPAKIAVTVVFAQGVFHAVFHALGATLGAASASVHHHHLTTIAPALPSPAMPTPLPSTAISDAPMLLAHLAAAALTSVLLWRGEQLVRSVARWVRAALLPRMPRLQGSWSTLIVRCAAVRPVIPAVRAGDICRRGPPVLSCS